MRANFLYCFLEREACFIIASISSGCFSRVLALSIVLIMIGARQKLFSFKGTPKLLCSQSLAIFSTINVLQNFNSLLYYFCNFSIAQKALWWHKAGRGQVTPDAVLLLPPVFIYSAGMDEFLTLGNVNHTVPSAGQVLACIHHSISHPQPSINVTRGSGSLRAKPTCDSFKPSNFKHNLA